jgi:hypothetical protein
MPDPFSPPGPGAPQPSPPETRGNIKILSHKQPLNLIDFNYRQPCLLLPLRKAFSKDRPGSGIYPLSRIKKAGRKARFSSRIQALEGYFSGMPSFFRILPRGQKPENPNWKRLAPTKAVNHNQYLL